MLSPTPSLAIGEAEWRKLKITFKSTEREEENSIRFPEGDIKSQIKETNL